MAPVECSVPGCGYVTPDTTGPQMLSYLTLHTNAVHLANQAAPAVVVSQPRPVFSLNMTEADWQIKETDWTSYIEQEPCSDNTKLSQLRAACNDSLRQRVCESGGRTLHTVPLLLARMKELAVVKIHKSRHLANLYDIVQQPDEPVNVHSKSNTVGHVRQRMSPPDNFPEVGSYNSHTPASVQSVTISSPTKCQSSDAPTSPTESSHSCARQEKDPQPPPIPPLLHHGDHVLIEEQHRNNPKQWTKTGVVAEVESDDSYIVSVDKSRQKYETYQDPPRLSPRQSSSPQDTSSTTPPAEIIPPPWPPEPDLPAEAQPASPMPAQQPVLSLYFRDQETNDIANQ